MASRTPFNYPRFRAFDGKGKPLEGGTAEFFVAGTTTPKSVFSDTDLTVIAPNPVTLNARGEPESGGGTPIDLYLDSNPYKVVLKDSDGVTVWTIDNYQASSGVSEDNNVSLLSDLRGLTAGSFSSVYIRGRTSEGDGGEGHFRWDSSDLSTEVGNDEVSAGEGDGGIYVAPASDKTGASGAWVRKYSGGVNILWYGATGDGITDDSSAIQSAIDSVSGAGGTVFIPEGSYGVSASVIMKSNVRLAGQGTTSKVVALFTDGSDVITNEGASTLSTSGFNPDDESIIVSRIYVDGNGRNQSSGLPAGIRLVNVRHAEVHNVWAENCRGYGIELKAAWDSSIHDNRCTDCGDDGISVSDLGIHDGSGLTKNIKVHDNVCWNNVGDPAFGVTTETGSGIEVDDGPSNILIYGNHCFNNVVGIELHRHEGAPLVNGCVVYGNYCGDNQIFQIRVTAFGSETSVGNHNKIEGNVVENSSGSDGGGIGLIKFVLSSCINNMISDISPTTSSYNALRVDSCSFSDVKLNKIDNVTGTTALAVVGGSDTVAISDNDFRQIGSDGISIETGCTRCFVYDNQIPTAGGVRFVDNASDTRKRWTEETPDGVARYDIDGTLECTSRITLPFNVVSSLEATWSYPTHGGIAFDSAPSVYCEPIAESVSNYAGDNTYIMGGRPLSEGVSSSIVRVYRINGGVDFESDTTIEVNVVAKGKYLPSVQP